VFYVLYFFCAETATAIAATSAGHFAVNMKPRRSPFAPPLLGRTAYSLSKLKSQCQRISNNCNGNHQQICLHRNFKPKLGGKIRASYVH